MIGQVVIPIEKAGELRKEWRYYISSQGVSGWLPQFIVADSELLLDLDKVYIILKGVFVLL
ncbi:hypothetical protein IW492_00560 [Enterococcus sp. BWB1-3]|uniref:hypothetical protein n=1 Tax=Enterococcus sp. BWB1-3 TaxID=2787713 RepID=UPI001F4124B5|nr:hypothetical protein [Enterococcus sp. BWB1-3]MBL1227721.1 hypothetical protein [Enterococcus sp. BWB1-3]